VPSFQPDAAISTTTATIMLDGCMKPRARRGAVARLG
jgi:hypothetical protein